MFPLLRPLFFAHRVRRAILAVPGVKDVRVGWEVRVRPVVKVTRGAVDNSLGWRCGLANVIFGVIDQLGGYVDHEFKVLHDDKEV